MRLAQVRQMPLRQRNISSCQLQTNPCTRSQSDYLPCTYSDNTASLIEKLDRPFKPSPGPLDVHGRAEELSCRSSPDRRLIRVLLTSVKRPHDFHDC